MALAPSDLSSWDRLHIGTDARGPARLTPPSPRLASVILPLLIFGNTKYFSHNTLTGISDWRQATIELALNAASLAVALWCYLRRPRPLPVTRHLLGAVIFGALALLWSIRSWYPLFSLARGIIYLVWLTTITVTVSLVGWRRTLLQFYVTVLAFCAAGLLASAAAPESFPLFRTAPGEIRMRSRLVLFNEHPIALASLLGTAFLFGKLARPGPARIGRPALLFLALLTVSRFALCVLALHVLWDSRLGRGDRTVRVRLGYVAIVFGLVMSLMVAIAILSDGEDLPRPAGVDILALATQSARDTSLSGRVELWKNLGADLGAAHAAGYGFSGAREYIRYLTGWSTHAHSSFLELVYTAGYVGAAAFFLGYFCVLRRILKHWMRFPSAVIGLSLSYGAIVGLLDPVLLSLGSTVSLVCGAASLRDPDGWGWAQRGQYGREGASGLG